MKIVWRWYAFEELTGKELYAILALRQEVFVVEQQCPYLDCDGHDLDAWHLVGRRTGDHTGPLAYLRVIPPHKQGDVPAIGRLLTHFSIRRTGVGRELLAEALGRIDTLYPGLPVRMSAQYYLLEFYQCFGFSPVSEVYDEDGLPHIAMIRPPETSNKLPREFGKNRGIG
jgi:ElaA protein